MKAWTDYPILELGDESGKRAPIRQVEVLSYDGNKYCKIIVEGIYEEIKSGYLYQQPGRCGEVPTLTRRQLAFLQEQTKAPTGGESGE
jgi:hypothetical protein